MELVEDRPEIEQTWRKIETISKQTGLREGISDGRDSSFQESFDIGYSEGFKNGYLLGKSKGSLLFQQLQLGNFNAEAADHPSLEKITRGDCIICKDPKLLEADIDQIKTQQQDLYTKNEKLLRKLTISEEKTSL